MSKQLDPKIAAILDQYGFTQNEACWWCHNVWVVYHKVLEQIASKAGIQFEPPQIIEADGANKTAALCATGVLDGKIEWSIGEASPGNNKNAYPWAMAEKRAKDRVILKLIGLHGLAYSEEEADDFKPNWHGPFNKTTLQEKCRELAGLVKNAKTIDALNGVTESRKTVIEQVQIDLPQWFHGDGAEFKGLDALIKENRERLMKEKEQAA